jgi:TonB family protein
MARSQSCIALLATVLVALPSLLRAQVSSQLLSQARAQIAAHRLDSAAVLLRSVALDQRADSTGRAEAFLWLGVVAFYAGQDSSARQSFREALRHDELLVGAPVLANLDSTLADIWEGEQTKALCGELVPAWGWPPDPLRATAMNREARLAQGPETISRNALWYPPKLRSASIQGRVLVRAIVDADGRPEHGSVRILSTPHHGFNDSVLDYTQHAQFRPATADGKHVRSCVVMPIDFRIAR